MKASWENQVIAESDNTVIIEGNHYFPPGSVTKEFLCTSEHTTICPWKGEAHYYDIVIADAVNINAAWYYPAPKSGSTERVGQDFTNYIAFWKGVAMSEG